MTRQNLNTGKPWSEMDLADLRAALEDGATIEEAADFLCRELDEVRRKAAELGEL